MQLLVDDGIRHRTSRAIIFDKRWKLSGVSSCYHKTQGNMTIILYATSFKLNEMGKRKLALPLPKLQLKKVIAVKDLGITVVGTMLDQQVFVLQNKLRTHPEQFLTKLIKMSK